MNGKKASKDWKFWNGWVLFGTFGYGGGMGGWYLALIMWLLLYVPLAIVIVMTWGGVIAGTWPGLMYWEVVQLNAPPANNTTWTAVNMVGVAIGLAISWAILFGILMEALGIWRGFYRNQFSGRGQRGFTGQGNGRYPLDFMLI